MISRKQFNEGKFPNMHSKIAVHPILLFLRKNKDVAFTVKEISQKTNMKVDGVRSMLRKLVKRRSVLHKSPYFIANIR